MRLAPIGWLLLIATACDRQIADERRYPRGGPPNVAGSPADAKPSVGDSLVTWSGEELLDTTPVPPPRETTAFMRVERLPLATDSPRVLATAGQPPDDRFCRGDTLVWFWHRGLEVSFLDGYIVESHFTFPAGFESFHDPDHEPMPRGPCMTPRR
jgi:hypothetical protein